MKKAKSEVDTILDKPKKIPVNVEVNEDILERVRATCKRRGHKMREAVQFGLIKYLEAVEKK